MGACMTAAELAGHALSDELDKRYVEELRAAYLEHFRAALEKVADVAVQEAVDALDAKLSAIGHKEFSYERDRPMINLLLRIGE